MNKLIKPIDLLLIAVLLLAGISAGIYLKKSTQSAVAVIYVDGDIYQSIELDKVSEPYTVDLPCSPEAALLVEKGCISFSNAACSDKICINSGKLTHRGDTAACLPAQVVVAIENGEESEIDALVY